MESDLQQQQPHQFQNHHYQQQMNSGLMRYRSAPSSFFANFLDDEQYLHVRPSSPETERFIARFMAEDSSSLPEIQKNSPPTEHQHQHQQQTQFAAPMKHEPEGFQQQHQQPQNGYSSAAPLVYQSSSRPPLPNHSASATASEMDGHYRGVTSMAVDHQLPPAKMGGGGGGGGGDGNNSNLIRQSSSPPGLFSHVNIENGYGIMRGMGNFGSINGTNGEASFSSASRLKGQINFSSGPPSSSGLMTHMPDIGNKSLGASSPDSGSFSDGRGNNGCYLTGFPIGSWEDSGILSENLNDLRRAKDDDRRTFSGLNVSETQHGRPANHNHTPAGLPRHLSLPKTSSEIAAIEKYLQFQDSVPCKIRAKRGCATHPRSIAERVRRTRISERMRKLQELVPNMDKQTSTADMLDLAVEYIKDLQKQVKTLNDTRAKCTCSNKRKQP